MPRKDVPSAGANAGAIILGPGLHASTMHRSFDLAIALIANVAMSTVLAGNARAQTSDALSEVRYTLAPALRSGHLVGLDVMMRFRGDQGGVTILELPNEWAGQKELWRNIKNLAVFGATSVLKDNPAIRTIHARPHAPLIVRYRVTSGVMHEPNIADRQPFQPWIRPDWFYVTGEGVFAMPRGREDAPATFDWKSRSRGYPFASSLEFLAGEHRSKRVSSTVSAVTTSVSIGGAGVRILQPRGSATRLAIRGRYPFSDDALYDLAARVISAERAFWRDAPAPFLITVGPVEASILAKTIGGTGRSDAFLLAIAETSRLADMRELLAHEFEHHWIAGELGAPPTPGNEGSAYWFSEGFTDFYMRRVLVRAGLITPAEFVASWNEMLVAYASSSARAAPNDQIRRDYWNDPDLKRLPYQRGALLAAIWDRRLRDVLGHADGLDEVLRAQRKAAHEATTAGREDAVSRFEDAAMAFGLDVRPEIDRYITRGEPIQLAPDAFGPCLTVTSTIIPRFDRGYDAQATADAENIVHGLRIDSPAYAAGLRDGMKLLRRTSGKVGDSRVDYELVVIDGQLERAIRYIPQGGDRIPVQELSLKTMPEKSACAL
jgi:predicted metalloprotease with PDZ domain